MINYPFLGTPISGNLHIMYNIINIYVIDIIYHQTTNYTHPTTIHYSTFVSHDNIQAYPPH